MALRDKLSSMNLTTFKFSGIRINTTRENLKVYTFYLADPIRKVVGSQRNTDLIDDPLFTCTNVEEINVTEEIIGKYDEGFSMIDDENGQYSGNLLLDISKDGRVWLLEESFGSIQQRYRAEYRQARLAKLMESFEAKRIREEKERKAARLMDIGTQIADMQLTIKSLRKEMNQLLKEINN